MGRLVKIALFVGVVVFSGSPEGAFAQYATGPDGQYAGRAQASAVQKRADEPDFFSLEQRVGYLFGHTLYQIRYPLYVGESSRLLSELKFPMDASLAGVSASFGRIDVWDLGVAIATNISKDTGKMKDSDWMDVNPATKSVYSESDTKMDAILVDVVGKFNVLRRETTTLGVMVGYRDDDLKFEARNVNQVCLTETGCSELGSAFVPGKVLTYKMTYKIPYGGLALILRPSPRASVNLTGALGRAYAKDEDNHVLRGKRASAESEGPYYSLKAEGRFTLTPQLLLTVGAEYLVIDAEGKQNQVCYTPTPRCPFGEGTTGIDYKAKSEQTTATVGLRYVW